jgi:hypothetical protein
MKSASMISATLGDRIGRRRLLLSVRPATGDERPEALISLDVQDLRSDVVLIDVEVNGWSSSLRTMQQILPSPSPA